MNCEKGMINPVQRGSAATYIEKLLDLRLGLLLAMTICLQEEELEVRGQIEGLQVGADMPQLPLQLLQGIWVRFLR